MDQQQMPPQSVPPQQVPPPQMPPPEQQPQWAPPPQQPAGWGGPGYGGPPPRPTGVTLAGIFLIVIGVLLLLAALLLFAGGAFLGSLIPSEFGGGLFAGIAAFLGIFVLFWSILHFLGGIGSLQGKGWGRWTGIVVSVISVIFGGLGVLGSLGGGMDGGSLIYNVAISALYALVAWTLISASAYFTFRR